MPPKHTYCRANSRPQDQITAHLVAAHDLLTDLATSSGLTYPEKDAVAALRVVNGFLFEAAVAMASGAPIGASGVLEPHRWALMKLIEFNSLLPEEAQTLPAQWLASLGASKPTKGSK
ncbi:hypothetical protein K32_03660 [Kaistia sp. 32K]|nr:hypothetical protein K32_03660 [Kaistia sp. 32K]